MTDEEFFEKVDREGGLVEKYCEHVYWNGNSFAYCGEPAKVELHYEDGMIIDACQEHIKDFKQPIQTKKIDDAS